MVFRRQREHISTVQCHSRWFTLENTGQNTETKDNPEKANNTKYSKTKLPGLVVFTTLGQETR